MNKIQEYIGQQKSRRIKQLIITPIFVIILGFGWQYPVLGFFIPLCMLLGIGFGLWRGRVWCNWYCPRGSFYDALMSPVSPKKEIPALLRGMPFRLAVIVLLMAIMTVNLILRWPDMQKIGLFFVAMLTTTTILGIILALAFHQRSWCMICPIGTMVNLAGGHKYPLQINSEICVECKLCAKVCPIQIKPYMYKGEGMQLVADRDCLKCGLCISACPKKALSRVNK